MRFLAVIAFLTLLPACQTTEQVSLERDTQCRSYGAVPGSDAYVNCRVGLEQKAALDAQTDAQRSQSIINGLAIMNAAVASPAPPPTTTCRTNYFAGTATTTCN